MVFLFTMCMILPALYAFRRSYSRGRVEVNHVTLFTAGFLAYWVLPIGVVLLLSSQMESTLGSDLMGLYAGAKNMSEYLVLCGIIYLAFVGGDQLGKRKAQKARTLGRMRPISQKLLAQFAGAAVIIAALAFYAARSILLKGSYIADTDLQQRGTAAAACIFLFIMAIIYIDFKEIAPRDAEEAAVEPLHAAVLASKPWFCSLAVAGCISSRSHSC